MSVRSVSQKVTQSIGLAALIVMIATVILAVTFDSIPPAVRYAPFLLSVVLLGLPHGAADHLIPARLGATSVVQSISVVSVLYAVLGGAYMLAWFLSPVISFVGFILLTWFHWGQGDVVHAAKELNAPQYRTPLGRIIGVFVRGGLPMGLPLVFFPEIYQRVAEYSISFFSVESLGLGAFFGQTTRVGVGVALATASVALLLVGWKNATSAVDTRNLQVTAVELVLLWLFFALVPPILAIGVYFCFWHALRHIHRITNSAAISRRQFALDAAPTTAAAIVLTGLIGLVAPAQPTQVSQLFGLYLVGIAVFTLPHVAVVSWMDRRDGLW